MPQLNEYKIEKTKHGVRVTHDGKEVHTAKDAVSAQKWIEASVHESEEGKYGDVDYADKKNKKYPIDTVEHIRAAWDYINMPKNAEKEEDVEGIKKEIVKAWKEKIDKDGPPSEEKDMSENFIDATLKQNYIGAEQAFKEIISSQVRDYLENRKQEIAFDMALGEDVKVVSSHKSANGKHEFKIFHDTTKGMHKARLYTDGRYVTDHDFDMKDKSKIDDAAKSSLAKMN